MEIEPVTLSQMACLMQSADTDLGAILLLHLELPEQPYLVYEFPKLFIKPT